MQSFLMSSVNHQEIVNLDAKVCNALVGVVCIDLGVVYIDLGVVSFHSQIHETVDQINAIKLQRDFYLGFAQNPQVLSVYSCILSVYFCILFLVSFQYILCIFLYIIGILAVYSSILILYTNVHHYHSLFQ